jgi:indole-3-glycerol phosphate synthase
MEDTPDILRKIVLVKREEVKELAPKSGEFRVRCADLPPAADFASALRKGPRPGIIAEVKKASPSAGIIAADFNPKRIAMAYEAAGAGAISVLTDRQFFQGSTADLASVRSAVSLPILRKDFIIDPIQIHEARCLGADSFLLIAAILDAVRLREFLEIGRAIGMEALVEVHSRDELEKVLETDAAIIGVNNRNLRTFEVSLQTSSELIGLMPKNTCTVSESGIRTPEDARFLHALGFDALLVGQSLMESGAAGCAARIAAFRSPQNEPEVSR